MSASRFWPSRLLLPLVLPLLGCPPADDNGPQAPLEIIWEEDSDDDNNHPTDAEPVSITWTDEVIIRGSMSSCGYDNEEDWPWTGDEDNYRVEVPEDGYIDTRLTWDHDSDLDMLVYFEPPSGGIGSVSPDEFLTSNNDDGEIEYLFNDEFQRGDDFVLAVLCASGDGGDYDLLVRWEN